MRDQFVQLLSWETGGARERTSFRDSFAKGDRKDRGRDMGVELVEPARPRFHEAEVKIFRYKGEGPLTQPSPARGVGAGRSRCNGVPSPPPHPLADAVMLSCGVAKASSPGEDRIP